MAEVSKKAIFIRNLPENATRTTKCNGFGYVHFSGEDGEKAIQQYNGKKFPNSNNKIFVALSKKRTRKGEKNEEMTTEESKESSTPATKKPKKEKEIPKPVPIPKEKKIKPEKKGENEKKEEVAPKKEDKKSTHPKPVPVPEVKKIKPEKKGDNEKKEDKKPTVESTKEVKKEQTKETTQPTAPKQKKKSEANENKIIIRNIPFSLTEKELNTEFSAFGQVMEAKIPESAPGRKKGFAFVKYSNREEATKAIENMNGKSIKGRTVVVDFAVAREIYLSAVQNAKQTQQEKQEEDEDSNKSEDENDEDKEDEDEEDEDEEEEGNEDEDEDDEDDDSDEDEEEEAPKKEIPQREEGCSIFLRNVLIDSTRSSIFNVMKQFGDIEGVYIVKDKVTGISKGTAFVNFKKKEFADKCIEYAHENIMFPEEESNIVIDGRSVIVMRAVDQQTAEELKKKNAKKQLEEKSRDEPEIKKNRNLHLANEGLILRGTPAATKVSESDFIKREHAQAEKKAKLRNPNYFVSDTRLAVRNLPKELTEAGLKDIFLKATPSGRLKQVKILREKSEEENKKEKSKGIAFVEYYRHEDALTALRKINNNPEIFRVDKRPIVEFALDNIATLRNRMLAKENLKENQKQGSGWQNPSKDRPQPKGKEARNKNKDQGRERNPRQQQRGGDTFKKQQKEIPMKHGNKRKPEQPREKAQKPPKKQKVSKEWEKEKKFEALINEYKSKYFS